MKTYERNFVPKSIKNKEVIWGYVPFIKYPFTKRELIFFVIGCPLIFPAYHIYRFIAQPKEIIDFLIMGMILIFLPLITALLSHVKPNGTYIENALINNLKYKKNAKVLINEKSLNRLNKKGG